MSVDLRPQNLTFHVYWYPLNSDSCHWSSMRFLADAESWSLQCAILYLYACAGCEFHYIYLFRAFGGTFSLWRCPSQERRRYFRTKSSSSFFKFTRTLLRQTIFLSRKALWPHSKYTNHSHMSLKDARSSTTLQKGTMGKLTSDDDENREDEKRDGFWKHSPLVEFLWSHCSMSQSRARMAKFQSFPRKEGRETDLSLSLCLQ